MRQILRVISIAMITASVVVLADVAMTLAWKEPISSLYATLAQDDAERQVAELEGSFPHAEGRDEAEVRRRARKLAYRFEDEITTGNGIGLITIPSIDARYALVQGTDLESLKRGPGHYPRTALPGQGDTVGVAAHRTTYLAPFRNIDELEEGDEIEVQMPYATFTYAVDHHRIVTPETLGVVRSTKSERLVLTACHPLHSAAQRYVVFGDLKSVVPT
ncbi:MAG: sortase [Solirubrobacterales bacterium]